MDYTINDVLEQWDLALDDTLPDGWTLDSGVYAVRECPDHYRVYLDYGYYVTAHIKRGE